MNQPNRTAESTSGRALPPSHAAAGPSAAQSPAAARPEVTLRVTPRAPDEASRHDRTRFPRQTYPLRILGLSLGMVCVGGTLAAIGAAPWAWALLLVHGLAWPHLARWRALRSADPRGAEHVNLGIDSAVGAMWVAVMGVALVPSMALISMLAMEKAAVGGWRLLLRHLPIKLGAFTLAWVALGVPFEPTTGMAAMLAALPLLLAQPVAIASSVHALGRRVRQQNRTLREVNRTDTLTGLGNRRAVEQALASEFHRCERSGRPAALLLVDLDRFKRINDEHGHGFGDEVLRRMGLAIRDVVREIDTAARLGGDEFAILLPETESDSAVQVAARIRAAISAQIFERAPGICCTASIGVASVAPVADGVEAWVERADRALYAAKDDGRDCVRAAP